MPVNMIVDGKKYSPDRDLGYAGPKLVHRAMLGLDTANQELWIKDYLIENKISEDELTKAAQVLAKYMNAALDPKHKQPFNALTEAGFFDLNVQVQHIVCAKLGQVLLCMLFPCVRDVVRDPRDPPFNLKEFDEQAELMVKKMKQRNDTWPWMLAVKACISRMCQRLGL